MYSVVVFLGRPTPTTHAAGAISDNQPNALLTLQASAITSLFVGMRYAIRVSPRPRGTLRDR
jgi:hypothetical protein